MADVIDEGDRSSGGVSLLCRETPGLPFRAISLVGERLRIGRKYENDLILSHSSVSRYHAEILRDDIASKGPVRLSEVEQAQKEILAVVLRLSEEGTVMLTAGGDEFV